MKAKELRERSVDELQGLQRTLERQMFDTRFKNHTNRLDDTSLIAKTRRDLARVLTVLNAKKQSTEQPAAEKSAT